MMLQAIPSHRLHSNCAGRSQRITRVPGCVGAHVLGTSVRLGFRQRAVVTRRARDEDSPEAPRAQEDLPKQEEVTDQQVDQLAESLVQAYHSRVESEAPLHHSRTEQAEPHPDDPAAFSAADTSNNTTSSSNNYFSHPSTSSAAESSAVAAAEASDAQQASDSPSSSSNGSSSTVFDQNQGKLDADVAADESMASVPEAIVQVAQVVVQAASTAAAAATTAATTSTCSTSTPAEAPATATEAPAATAAATAPPAPEVHSHPLNLDEEEGQGDFLGIKELRSELQDSSQLGHRGEGWVLAQLATLLLLFFPPLAMKGLVDLLGTLAMTAGAVFMLYGVLSLGRNFSPLAAPRKRHCLVTSGMYSYVRHPMYAGLLLMALGLTAFTRSETRLAMTALLWWVLERKVADEERLLAARYPEYPLYCQRVKKFFPYVY